MSIKRKMRRQAEKEADKEFQAKVALFDRLQDNCLVCDKPFDKKNKEMVMSWYVAVRQKEEAVNLYCPECWDRGLSLVQTIKEDLNERTKKQNQV
tara:strand:+ start:434 stop:718 length:285 start_codon:yes stop_codon:yes gene_type:complete